MKIVVLNECSFSEQHLADLAALGTVENYNDTTDEATAIKRMAGKDIVLADMFECPLNAKVLGAADQMKLLCLNTTGYDRVDGDAVKSKKFLLANVPGYSTEAVAEHSFALLLSVVRHIIPAASAYRAKPFGINPIDKAHEVYKGINLSGKTLGIYGYGAIGGHVAKIAQGFGMRVIHHSRTSKPGAVSFDELLAQSDVLSIHASLNAQSRHAIDVGAISKMKHGAYLINTSADEITDTTAIAAALVSGKLAGAGLDGLHDSSPENPIFNAPNCVISPSMGWFTQGSLDNMGDIIVANVKAFVEGRPQNIVA